MQHRGRCRVDLLLSAVCTCSCLILVIVRNSKQLTIKQQTSNHQLVCLCYKPETKNTVFAFTCDTMSDCRSSASLGSHFVRADSALPAAMTCSPTRHRLGDEVIVRRQLGVISHRHRFNRATWWRCERRANKAARPGHCGARCQASEANLGERSRFGRVAQRLWSVNAGGER